MNLLPPEQKQVLLLEEKFKVVFISGIIILAFLVSFIFILISIKILDETELKLKLLR